MGLALLNDLIDAVDHAGEADAGADGDDDIANSDDPRTLRSEVTLPKKLGTASVHSSLSNFRSACHGANADSLSPAKACPITAVAQALQVPSLHELLRRFLREQLYPDLDEHDIVIDVDDCPWISPNRSILELYQSATATFYAPSELAGPGGMHSEVIRCSPSWFKQYPRYDTVLVQLSEAEGMDGMGIARVRAFLAFSYGITRYECALVEWYELIADERDHVMNMWVVKPELIGHQPVIDIISVDTIVRSCHLIPDFGHTQLPTDFHFSHTLDAFQQYFVNVYADYHTHELLST